MTEQPDLGVDMLSISTTTVIAAASSRALTDEQIEQTKDLLRRRVASVGLVMDETKWIIAQSGHGVVGNTLPRFPFVQVELLP